MTDEEKRWLDFYKRQAEGMRAMPSFASLIEKEKEEKEDSR